MSLIEFINSNEKLLKSNRIIYYGGSFNPWHDGHTFCVKAASEIAPLVIIPDNNPQKKQLTHRTSPEGIKNLIKTFSDNIFLFEGFFNLDHKTPTIDWISEVKQNFSNISHCLLLGHDSFVNLDTWINYQRILECLDTIYVVARLDDEGLNELRASQYNQINPKLKIHFLGHHPYEHICSSDLRSNT